MINRVKFSLITILTIFLLPSVYASDIQTGGINVDSFSWSFDNENIKVDLASARVISYPASSVCGHYNGTKDFDICGVAISITGENGSHMNIVASGGGGFSATQAVNAINSLSGKSFPLSSFSASGMKTVTGACLYIYRKGNGEDGTYIIPGVCSGGPLPPQPSPAKCEVSLNNNLVDFGKIPASKFVNAGSGNAPDGVLPQTRSINIKCSGGTGSESLRFIVKTNKVSGDYILSNDENIGFAIKNESGDIMVPNASLGAMKITTTSDGLADILISAVPVSISGKKPAIGEFSAVLSLVVENE